MPPARPANRPAARRLQRGPHLYRRGAVYYARGGAALPAKGVSLHTSDRAEAERRLRDLLVRGDAAGDRGAAAGAREADLARIVADWLSAPHGYTRRTLESHSERVSAALAWLLARSVTLASEITEATLDAWITERAQRVSRRTINRDVRSLRVCLRWAAGRGLCAVPRALERPGLREAAREVHRYLPDPAEVRRVLDLIPTEGYRDALTLLYATGLRHEELMRLGVGDVRDGRVWVQPEAGPAATAEPSKGYRARAIPVAPEVVKVATRWLAWRQPGEHGRHAGKNVLHAALKAACATAKVSRFGLHDLRRAFATQAVRAGVPLTVVRDWLGHRLVATTERYVGRYRSDADLVAPVPAGLGAEVVQKSGAVRGLRGPISAPSKKTAGRR